MKLKELLGYNNREGRRGWSNFRAMLWGRVKRWVKDDRDALVRLNRCNFISEYLWHDDLVVVHVKFNGKLVFTLTDPDDQEQLQALAFTLKLLEDTDDGTLSRTF